MLTGPSRSGKSSLVTLLASLTGNTLTTLSLTQSTDTLELLGGFEQGDLDRSVGGLVVRMVGWGRKIGRMLMEDEEEDVAKGLLLLQAIQHLQEEGGVGRSRRREQMNLLVHLLTKMEQVITLILIGQEVQLSIF